MSSIIRTIILCIVLSLFSHSSGYGQNDYGKVWVQGGGVSFKKTFDETTAINQYFDTIYSPYFSLGNSNICDSSGKLLVVSDGYNLYDGLSEMIPEGDSLVPKLLYEREGGWSVY